jgi:threonyl-tRNA synthetase
MIQSGIRATTDLGPDCLNAKIRNAQLMKVPYLLVVGDHEMGSDTVAIRQRSGARDNEVPVAQFIADLRERIARVQPTVRQTRLVADADEPM